MNFSMRRMNAIFQKDLKDLSKNMYVSTTLILPFILAIFYRKMDIISIETHFLIINLTFVAVTFFIQSAMIAEEKEKNTLRGLMLSPATLPEILGGKSLVSFLLTLVTLFLCVKILGYEPAQPTWIVLGMIISALFYLALGTLLGLLSRSVIEASVIMLPAMFIFGFGSFLELIIDKYPVLTFTTYLPNLQLIDLANKVESGAGIGSIWIHLAIIFAWFVVAAVITVIVFKKREMDD
ncbi:ABC-2 type transport system permease protein [Virgibacillus halotolerans]|uniref:ABC transporter permease n=1 Tax=Virgibacillus halotolerans TaxID=1071053 RepID=UPI00196079CB|nr:ABC transporter permease [Virgibacillus halotolerans]MBM7599676.1 ABC-2 type transport system permease protein [Virgibacillus halotolerans]